MGIVCGLWTQHILTVSPASGDSPGKHTPAKIQHRLIAVLSSGIALITQYGLKHDDIFCKPNLIVVYLQYTTMIASFKHKGLKLLWTKGDRSKVPANLAEKIKRILVVIDNIELIPDDLEGLQHLRPHLLKGNLDGFWSMAVSGNWRIIFQFNNKTREANVLDFLDYH